MKNTVGIDSPPEEFLVSDKVRTAD